MEMLILSYLTLDERFSYSKQHPDKDYLISKLWIAQKNLFFSSCFVKRLENCHIFYRCNFVNTNTMSASSVIEIVKLCPNLEALCIECDLFETPGKSMELAAHLNMHNKKLQHLRITRIHRLFFFVLYVPPSLICL